MTDPHPTSATPEMIDELAAFFKTLGEPVRLRLLYSLCSEGEATVGELVNRLNIQQSVGSKHMKLLYESGLVEKKKAKSRTLYYLADDALCRLCGMASSKIMERAVHYKKLLDKITP